MPYATATTPFTGDNDISDFMANVWLPFARDDCKWVDNQAPSPNGIGTSTSKVWTHRVARGGSPVAVTSPYTPQAPYVFYEPYNNHMFIYTGTGIDVTKNSWNQPGNPNNYWNQAGVVDDGAGLSYVNGRGIWINDIIGTFQKYWLFSDAEGRYIHCVIQPRAREYRHFHIGLLTPLHPDLDPESFYVTGHFWDSLYSRFTASDTETDNQAEHAPYELGRGPGHRIPFAPSADGAESFGLPRPEWVGTWYNMPGLNAHDWYVGKERDQSFLTASDYVAANKGDGSPIGEGVAVPSALGISDTSYYGRHLGACLFAADKTFTSNTNSLIPILVSARVSFASLNRQGVVGQVPDVYRINMRDYAPGEEIAVGSDTYVVFPVINDDAANCLDGEGYSGYEGLAYKKITATVP